MTTDQRHDEVMHAFQQLLDQIILLRNQAAELFEEVTSVRAECIELHAKLDTMSD